MQAKKTKWKLVDLDAIEKAMGIMDKLHTFFARGIIDQNERDVLMTILKSEINEQLKPAFMPEEEEKPKQKKAKKEEQA